MTNLPSTKKAFWPSATPTKLSDIWVFDGAQNDATHFLSQNWAHHRHLANKDGLILKDDIPHDTTWFSNEKWSLMVLNKGGALMYTKQNGHAAFLPVPLQTKNPTQKSFEDLCQWAETQSLHVSTSPETKTHFPWWGNLGFSHEHISAHINTLFSFLYEEAKHTHKPQAPHKNEIRWKMMYAIDAHTIQMPQSSFRDDSAESIALTRMGHFLLSQSTPFQKENLLGQKPIFGRTAPKPGPVLKPQPVSRHEMLNWMRTHANWENKINVHHPRLDTATQST